MDVDALEQRVHEVLRLGSAFFIKIVLQLVRVHDLVDAIVHGCRSTSVRTPAASNCRARAWARISGNSGLSRNRFSSPISFSTACSNLSLELNGMVGTSTS